MFATSKVHVLQSYPSQPLHQDFITALPPKSISSSEKLVFLSSPLLTDSVSTVTNSPHRLMACCLPSGETAVQPVTQHYCKITTNVCLNSPCSSCSRDCSSVDMVYAFSTLAWPPALWKRGGQINPLPTLRNSQKPCTYTCIY